MKRKKFNLQSIDKVAFIFKLVSGSPHCLEICRYLHSQDSNVIGIQKHCGITQSSTSLYLRLLRCCGLAYKKRSGRFNIYSATDKLHGIMDGISDLFDMKEAA